MTALDIYSIDDTESKNVIACLPEGKHVLGRGGLLQVTDKRVSRKHAVIEVSKDNVSLTSIHINPCFFKAANGKTLTVLSQSQQYELNDGDQFALLPETCWFKVKIRKEQQENKDENGVGDTGLGNNGKRLYDNNLEAKDFNSDSKRARLSTTIHDTSSHKEDTTSNNVTLELEANAENYQTSHSHEDSDNPEEPNTSLNLAETAISKQENNELIRDIKEEPKENENDNSNTPEPIESIPLNISNNVITNTDNNIIASQEIKHEPINNSVKEEPQPAEEDDIFEEPQREIKTENSDSNKQSKDGASGSGTGAKKVRRERCWYGDRCFRKNPNHRETFSHPGDQDYDSDPDDDRPDCPYGAACYRKNIEHRREYKHIGKPAPKPTPTPRISPSPPSSPTTQNNQVNQKKRRKAATKKPKTQNDIDSSQDDYDLDDPFINDGSSDDYQPSDGIDSDSDYEDSQELDEESQERARMLKEAKRFTRKGHKP